MVQSATSHRRVETGLRRAPPSIGITARQGRLLIVLPINRNGVESLPRRLWTLPVSHGARDHSNWTALLVKVWACQVRLKVWILNLELRWLRHPSVG
jgi:hypothetical protein